MKLANRFRDSEVVPDLRASVPDAWRVATWREYNRGIFGALRAEKTMMVFLVALIFVVVAGNIFQLLRRSILERSEEIAILRALGAGARDVRRVFALEGWIIGIVGAAVGTAVGLLIAGNIDAIFAAAERIALWVGNSGVSVFSPAHFYIDGVPSEISPAEIVTIGSGAIASAAVSAWLAGRTVVHRRPMELLRSE